LICSQEYILHKAKLTNLKSLSWLELTRQAGFFIKTHYSTGKCYRISNFGKSNSSNTTKMIKNIGIMIGEVQEI
jgi:hypothetical protein